MRWFDREFQFPFEVDIYPSLVERLRGLIPRVREKLALNVPIDAWIRRDDDTWSAQENLGHLADLEALWQGRHDDFDRGAESLRPADVENRKTDAAHHNRSTLEEVAERVLAARSASLERLQRMTGPEFARLSRHPRLDQPMRFVDHLYFIAEHDDHHLARITALLT